MDALVSSIFLILLVTLVLSVSIYFLLRRLLLRSLLVQSSSGDCVICLSAFEKEDKVRRLPLCLHAFHADCISIWLVSNNTCPLCRSPLDPTTTMAVAVTSAPASDSEASLAADVGHDGSGSFHVGYRRVHCRLEAPVDFSPRAAAGRWWI